MKIKKVDDKPMVIHTKEKVNTSIKTKNTNLHIAGRTGALAAGAVTEQIEGGREVTQAAYLAYEASRPVTGTAFKGAVLFRRKAAEQAKRRIKKVEAGKKLAKKAGKKAGKDTAKTVAKETAKETAKTTAKASCQDCDKNRSRGGWNSGRTGSWNCNRYGSRLCGRSFR